MDFDNCSVLLTWCEKWVVPLPRKSSGMDDLKCGLPVCGSEAVTLTLLTGNDHVGPSAPRKHSVCREDMLVSSLAVSNKRMSLTF